MPDLQPTAIQTPGTEKIDESPRKVVEIPKFKSDRRKIVARKGQTSAFNTIQRNYKLNQQRYYGNKLTGNLAYLPDFSITKKKKLSSVKMHLDTS